MKKLWEVLETNPTAKDGLVLNFSADICDQSEFWADDIDEFIEKFKACFGSKPGREFILFLVGHADAASYLQTLYDELDNDGD